MRSGAEGSSDRHDAASGRRRHSAGKLTAGNGNLELRFAPTLAAPGSDDVHHRSVLVHPEVQFHPGLGQHHARGPAPTSSRQISARGPVNHAPHGAYPRAGVLTDVGVRETRKLGTVTCLAREPFVPTDTLLPSMIELGTASAGGARRGGSAPSDSHPANNERIPTKYTLLVKPIFNLLHETLSCSTPLCNSDAHRARQL